uniref:Uncharacterized protein n=1 Tax=Ochrobactrum phage ORM_20 TaxID=2985243 RepID=A0A9N6ZFY6_9VIRU|nr:hypothetical protein ORM20_00030 [Ochrobactrum phage ORM_20]
MTKILADFPAYTIISPESNRLVDNEKFMVPFPALRNPREMIWREFCIGSVISYALRTGNDPIESLDHARKNGHELHYVFGLGSSITSHQRPHETKKGFHFGDVIEFEGIKFELVPAPNSNVALKKVSE